MTFHEFGEPSRDTVVLLHGGGLSWWNFREVAELLQNGFHVVVPVLDGHAGSDRGFTSIEDNAAEIISFIDERFGGHVKLVGGLSLGAQVLVEMLCRRGDVCSYAVVESAAVIPSPVTNLLTGPAFGLSYGLVKNRSFAKLQFKSLKIKPELFEDYYRDTCAISKADMVAFMKASTGYRLKDTFGSVAAQVFVFYGGKETRVIRRSAEEMRKALPGCTVRRLEGLYHGEFSINRAGEYAETLKTILEEGGVR